MQAQSGTYANFLFSSFQLIRRRAILDKSFAAFLRRSLPYRRIRPPGGRARWGVVQLVGHLTVNEDGEGSNPSAPAKFFNQSNAIFPRRAQQRLRRADRNGTAAAYYCSGSATTLMPAPSGINRSNAAASSGRVLRFLASSILYRNSFSSSITAAKLFCSSA